MSQHRVDVLPMSLEELYDAVRLPAANVGLRFEEGLVGDLYLRFVGKRGRFRYWSSRLSSCTKRAMEVS